MEYRCFCCDVDFDNQLAYEKHCKSDDKHIKLNLEQPLLFWEKFTQKFLDIAWADTKLKFCPLYLTLANPHRLQPLRLFEDTLLHRQNRKRDMEI